MAAESNDFKAIAAQKRLLSGSKDRNLPLENELFDCPRLECREPETRGTSIFCNPEKRCLFRRRTCKHLTSCFAEIISRARDGCYEQAYQRKEKKSAKSGATRKARRDFDWPQVCPTLR